MGDFSAIVDLAECNQDRINAVNATYNGAFPTTLQPVCARLQCGEQITNRAELSALIVVVLSVQTAMICKDSSYACNVFKEVQDQPGPLCHNMKEHFY